MTNKKSPEFFLNCINRTLSLFFIQRRFDVIRLFAGKEFPMIILYLIMRFYYQEKLGKIQLNEIPTLEFLFNSVAKRISRLSVSQFIQSMVNTGVLIRETASFDKRKSILRPSAILVNEFESMHLQRDHKLSEMLESKEQISLASMMVI